MHPTRNLCVKYFILSQPLNQWVLLSTRLFRQPNYWRSASYAACFAIHVNLTWPCGCIHTCLSAMHAASANGTQNLDIVLGGSSCAAYTLNLRSYNSYQYVWVSCSIMTNIRTPHANSKVTLVHLFNFEVSYT